MDYTKGDNCVIIIIERGIKPHSNNFTKPIMKTKFQNDLQFKTARSMMITAKGEKGFMGIDGGDMAIMAIFFVVMCVVITPIGAILITPIALIGGKLNQMRSKSQTKFEEKLVDEAVAKEEIKELARLKRELAALKAGM